MAKKHKKLSGGLVYSTDPDFSPADPASPEEETLPPGTQQLKVQLDTRHRAGKVVTLITGFAGRTDDLELLGKKLKASCGTGGSTKEGQVIIQGDYKVKIIALLKSWGYTRTR